MITIIVDDLNEFRSKISLGFGLFSFYFCQIE